MLDFKYKWNPKTGEQWLETSLTGKALLTIPQLNKGTAFTDQERDDFQLRGKLPLRIETLDEQVSRTYEQFNSYRSQLQRYIYLNNLHDKNQILFYKLVREHMKEILPTIYTPIVGTAAKEYSKEFRQPRGLYIAYSDQDHIEDILKNRSNPDIDIIVFTDGEGVLGIGDQGIGGMDIPVSKLMVYSLCGGINPCYCLPIFLDAGTNNKTLLNDPVYLGWRHQRIEGDDYDRFLEKVITAIKKVFPQVFLHWEDFGRDNARRNLKRYQDALCTFNDDIQGTGAVVLAALLAAVKANDSTLSEQRIVVFGAGSAGLGITEQLCDAMQRAGLSEAEAKERFWLIDKQGLLIDNQTQLSPSQRYFARPLESVKDWPKQYGYLNLMTTVEQVKPTVLIGCSGVTGAFRAEIIKAMAKQSKHPIIFPLSNPNENSEATPQDLLNWTEGRARIATGSPFPQCHYKAREIPIAQCNNALIFPGLGLGIKLTKAKQFSHEMLWQASLALADCSPLLNNPDAALLPSLSHATKVAKKIAYAVAKHVIETDLATKKPKGDLAKRIDEAFWEPEYVPYRLKT